jgi:sulfide:quinone oxidoreductase
MTVNGWIPVDKTNLKTQYSGVYAIGDVNSVGTPKAGVFAEGAAEVAAHPSLQNLREASSHRRIKEMVLAMWSLAMAWLEK